MRTFISLVVVLALALFSLWFQEVFQEAPIIRVKKDQHFPDYFMENFMVTSMNESGRPSYILQAQKLQHFADDDSSELTQPRLEFRQAQGNWRISADRAQMLSDQKIIHLYDNIQVYREASKNRDALRIATDYLMIDTAKQIASTDKLAHIRTQNFELNTRGMVFDNAQGILQLLSKVRGSYEASQ